MTTSIHTQTTNYALAITLIFSTFTSGIYTPFRGIDDPIVPAVKPLSGVLLGTSAQAPLPSPKIRLAVFHRALEEQLYE